MSWHCRMETCCTWAKSFFLSIINTHQVSHEFTHDVLMVVRWPESMLHSQPSGRKNYKIASCLAWVLCLCSEHCKNRWIWMIKWYRANSIEFPQVVLVRSIVSMPANNIKWWVVYLVFKESSYKFIYDRPLFFLIFIWCYWSLKISWICQTVCTNGPEVWKNEMTLI